MRDFLSLLRWQHQKRENSERLQLPSKMANLTASYQMRFAIFPLLLCKVLRLPRKSDARSYEVPHLSRKIILANLTIWCSKVQPLSGNQRPDLLTSLMNMSLVLRMPREMHLWDPLQMSHTCHLFLEMLQKPSRFAHFWQGAESLAPATQNHIWTFKSGRSMWCF